MDPDKLDQVVLQALESDTPVGDIELHARLQEVFPEVGSWTDIRGGAWSWTCVERSLMRLLKRGLVTARKNYHNRLVDWKAVNVLEELSKIV